MNWWCLIVFLRDYANSGSVYVTPDSGGECGVAYESYFPMPAVSKDKPWYSIEQGTVHFIVMSTEHEWSEKSEQVWSYLYIFYFCLKSWKHQNLLWKLCCLSSTIGWTKICHQLIDQEHHGWSSLGEWISHFSPDNSLARDWSGGERKAAAWDRTLFFLVVFMLYSGFWNLFCKMQEITIGISLAIADIDRCIPPMVVYCPTWIPTLLPLLSHSCSTTR